MAESAENVSKVKKPVKVLVEYCNSCGYRSKCACLTELLHISNPLAEVICKKGRQGSFEIYINDTPIYSKLQTKLLPNFNEVVEVIQKVSEGGPITPVKSTESLCVIS